MAVGNTSHPDFATMQHNRPQIPQGESRTLIKNVNTQWLYPPACVQQLIRLSLTISVPNSLVTKNEGKKPCHTDEHNPNTAWSFLFHHR